MDRTYVIKYQVQKEDDCYLLKGVSLVEAVEDGEDLIIDEDIEFVNSLIADPTLEEVYIETVTLKELKDVVGIDSDDEKTIVDSFTDNILATHYFIAKEQDGKLFTQQIEMESPIKQLVTDYLNIADENEEVTEEGLEQYLNERFVGYEEQNSQLARIIFNNLEIKTKEDNETILMVGKNTKVLSSILMYAAEYLNIPYKRIGIDRIDPTVQLKASTIEEEILDTIKEAASVEIAHISIIAIDGISEINNTSYGSRNLIIDNLRRFVEGETIYYSTATEDIPFDTSYLTKVFIGSFENYPTQEKELGFTKGPIILPEDTLIERLAKNKATNINLLSSIDNVITYKELSKEDKKRYLLTSKLSILVRKEIELNDNYQVELVGQEIYIDALVDYLYDKYSKSSMIPTIEEISREIRELLHYIIKTIKENEEIDIVSLDEDSVYNHSFQLEKKEKGMLN